MHRLGIATALVALTCAGCGQAVVAGGAAGPRKAAPRGLTVWAVGDAQPPRGKRLAALVRRERPDRFLYLGDVYETGTAKEFRTGYDALYGSLARRTTPTPGNHEWGNRATGYRPYWHRRLGRPIAYYSRRAIGQGWEVVSLNSEGAHDARSRQLAWLKAAVRRPGTCRIAIWHRARWSTGAHGDQTDMDPIWRALRGHARVVLSGHDHDLERLADRDGLRQIVSGAGGRPNVPPVSGSGVRLRFANRVAVGGARLRLTRGRATIELVRADGRVLDRSAVRCKPVR